MSSVLKALKNQSSPLVNGLSDVHLSSAKTATSPVARSVVWFVVAAFAAAVGWAMMQWWLTYNGDQVTSSVVHAQLQQTELVPQTAYQLGEMSTIKTPQWPQQTKNSNVDVVAADSSVANTEANGQVLTSRAQEQLNQRPVSDDQAIDLSQVSPELLSAFENALVEQTQGTGGSERSTSVVPPLTQLSYNFQRTISSFSYDGHQYSSRSQSRWIELSGVRLFEGEQFQGLTILTIAPAHVVLAKDNQAFQQPALEDWTKP